MKSREGVEAIATWGGERRRTRTIFELRDLSNVTLPKN